MNQYERFFMLEKITFEKIDFSNPNRPYTFNNTPEEVLFKERNSMESVQTESLPFSDFIHKIALIHVRIGNMSLAEQSFEKSLLWNPANVPARLSYMEYLLQGRYFESFCQHAGDAFRYVFKEEEYQKLLELMKGFFREINEKAGYTNENTLIRRVKKMGITVYAKEETADIFCKHGRIFETEGKPEEALECYKAAYELYPTDVLSELIRKIEKQ